MESPCSVCSPSDAGGDTTNDDKESGGALAVVVVSHASSFMKYFIECDYNV
jgi:hypothetical protein